MNHPDRMRAANEIPAADRPQPSTTMDQEDYDKAREQLHQVDPRIPPDVVKKAVQLLFSTNLLPDYDLSTCHVRELPSTSTLALIMPLPDTSHFQQGHPKAPCDIIQKITFNCWNLAQFFCSSLNYCLV